MMKPDILHHLLETSKDKHDALMKTAFFKGKLFKHQMMIIKCNTVEAWFS